MTYLKFKDLPLNEKTATVALLTAIEEKETKGGSSYCRLSLSDGSAQIEANLWNTSKEQVKVEEKSLITVELYPKVYQESVSFEVFRYGTAPTECNITDFVTKAPYAPAKMYDEILFLLRNEVAKTGASPNLVDLVSALYEEHKEKLLYWSAAKSVHHNCYGGLLYHIFRMMRSGVLLSKVYSFDKEVLLCGIALHDIGKLAELETDNLGIAEYSVDGTLFGHALLGIEMINNNALKMEQAGCPYNPEKIRLLKHVLCAHHGNLEWGAITNAATPEAMLLHQIDMIDSRMYQFEHTLESLETGEMSGRIFGLGNAVYKPKYQ